jgi:putative membrane protein
MWFWGDGMSGGWWMILGSIWMLLFWGGLIILVIWGIKKLSQKGGGGGEAKSALDIARERYARGEITKEQFEQMKKDLM